MDDDENTQLIEMDAEMDTDKKTRRSSILKPQKPRNPLSILDFSEANPDNTLGRATRRVSFASSNFVKPFAADPEKNTIWDTTYEEAVNHTDSTKSSCDQTYGTKASNFLNTTSLCSSTTELPQNYKSPVSFVSFTTDRVSSDIEKVQTVNEVGNSGESLVLLARKLRSKSVEQCDTETMDFTSIIKTGTEFHLPNETEKENVKLQENMPITSLFHKARNISCSITKLAENNMEMTCVTDKENVNPLINDLSLVIPKRNVCGTNVTKYFSEEEMDCTKSVKSSEKTVYFDKYENNLDLTELDMTKENWATDKNVYTKEYASSMEFTCIATEDNKENHNKIEIDSEKTVYFDKYENNLDFTELNITKENWATDKNVYTKEYASSMEFTCIATEDNNKENHNKIEIDRFTSNNASDDVKVKTTYFHNSANSMELTDKSGEKEFSSNKSNRKTILFNEMKGAMNCDVNSKENNEISRNIDHELGLRRETILFNQSNNDMEFTTTLPVRIYNNDVNNSQFQKHQETIHFDDFGEEMEFTNTLPIQKNIREAISNKDLKETVCFEESECKMELTTTLVGNINNSTRSQIDDKEIPTALSPDIKNKPTAIERDKTKFDSQMELTSSLNINANKLKQCDMSLTQNLCTAVLSSNVPLLIKNNNSDITDRKSLINSDKIKNVNSNTVNASSTSNMTFSDSLVCRNLSESHENMSSNSIVNGNPDSRTNFTTFDNTCTNNLSLKNRSLTEENGQQSIRAGNAMNYQGTGNDSSSANVSKDINDIKRHIIDSVDGDVIKKRRIQQPLKHDEASDIENICTESSVSKPILPKEKAIKSSKTDNITDPNALLTFESSSKKVQNSNLQTSSLSNTNILYSEPMILKTFVPIPELSAHLNLNAPLNLDHTSTPATSFHMNLSTMSPCIEDTQQLIHATFSKPETVKILSQGTEHSFDVSVNTENHAELGESPVKISTVSPRKGTSIYQDADSLVNVNEKTHAEDADFMKMSNESLKSSKSCFLEDITPLALVPEEFDQSGAEHDSSNRSNSGIKTTEQDDSIKNTSSDFGNYTLRSQMVLTNIKKHLLIYKPATAHIELSLLSVKENCRRIKELCNSPPHIIDLETKYKQDLEETLSSINEAAVSTDEDLELPSTSGLIARKTICEHIHEMTKRSKKYWEFVKMEDDFCYFYTLFGTMPFKVHIHPELGIVYSVKTYRNLSDLAKPICFYQLELFQQKLKQENLLSVLGTKFDIFALLDYVYMSMEEIIDFHVEYRSLIEKYGKSHHFRMNSDYSLTIEILNLKQIIWWIITVNMSLTNLLSVSKEDITAVHKLGKPVNEEHIKTIAENIPKGMNFLRNFIENVDEYVTRMGRKLKK